MSSPKERWLRADYRQAFEEWAVQVGCLKEAIESERGEVVIKTAQEQTLAAEAAYRDSRDRLTEDMMLDSAGDDSLRDKGQ